MVHADDRLSLADARKLMDLGLAQKVMDECHLIRPDGETIRLGNHRGSLRNRDRRPLGIPQDVTTHKQAVERITILLRELSHRGQSQFAVIIRVMREACQQSKSVEEFDELFRARMLSRPR